MAVNRLELRGEDQVPLADVIASLKSHNFAILELGVLTTGLSPDQIAELVGVQTKPPRQMKIFATQSTMIYDIYQDFTFLVNEKKVNAIVVLPSMISRDPSFIKKICLMSRQKKIPVIAMESAWVNSDAMLVYTEEPEPTLHVNQKVQELMKYPINGDKLFKLVSE